MDILDIVRLNLLSPMVLCFVLGAIASFVRSDLRIPEPIVTGLSIYLLLAIGLKGGVALAESRLGAVAAPILAGVIVGCVIPLWSYAIVRRIGRFDSADAAAIAAHYGSVSAVTFIACLAYLEGARVAVEGYMAAVLAMMEVPAIIIALLLAHGGRGAAPWRAALAEVVTGRSIILLAGGLVIGFLAGPRGYAPVAPFFVAPFQGVLCLFLLEMGMLAARRAGDVAKVGGFLIGFGLAMPVAHGVIGVLTGDAAGLSLGGATVMGVLAASASYIAAPAAVRVALPQANPGYYLTASLAITFPFNLVVGLPLIHGFARLIADGGAP
jgi:hypothetical protein